METLTRDPCEAFSPKDFNRTVNIRPSVFLRSYWGRWKVYRLSSWVLRGFLSHPLPRRHHLPNNQPLILQLNMDTIGVDEVELKEDVEEVRVIEAEVAMLRGVGHHPIPRPEASITPKRIMPATPVNLFMQRLICRRRHTPTDNRKVTRTLRGHQHSPMPHSRSRWLRRATNIYPTMRPPIKLRPITRLRRTCRDYRLRTIAINPTAKQ